MTMTACAMKSSMLNQLDLQTVICEEAGEAMEAQTLCTLFPSIKHAIFIGDPLQLRYGAEISGKKTPITHSTNFVRADPR